MDADLIGENKLCNISVVRNYTYAFGRCDYAKHRGITTPAVFVDLDGASDPPNTAFHVKVGEVDLIREVYVAVYEPDSRAVQ